MSFNKGKKSLVNLVLVLILTVSSFPALTLKAISVAGCSITEAGVIVDNIDGGMATQLRGASDVFVVGTTAYTTSDNNNALSAFNVSNPASITETGTIVASGTVKLDGANSLYVVGNVAYVTALNNDSLATFDISNPASIMQSGSIISGMTVVLESPTDVFVLNNKAYVTSNDMTGDGNLTIIDVTNPAMLSQSGTINDGGGTNFDGAQSVFVVGTTAYVAASGDDSLTAFDVSNPASITFLGEIINGGATKLDGANSVFVVGTKAYVTSDVSDSLTILDVTTPGMITQLGTIQDNSQMGSASKLDGAHGVYVSGNNAYVTGENSLSIFDISNPASITEIATISDGAGATKLSGANSVFFLSDKVYTTAGTENSLSVFSLNAVCTATPTPTPIGISETPRNNVAAPVITSPVNGDTTGPVPVITGTAVRGVKVVVRENNVSIGSAYSSSTDGVWTISNFPAFTNGSHTITAVVDSAADTSAPSASVTFTVEGGAGATATPTATPESSPTATPEASPSATPEASPSATPEASPSATPESSPEASPSATPDTGLDPDQLAPAVVISGDNALTVDGKGRENVKLTLTGSNLDSMIKCNVTTAGNVAVLVAPKKFPISPKNPSSKFKISVPKKAASALISAGSPETVTVTVTCGTLSDTHDITLTPAQ